jgi:TolB-like protein/DNA-binding winged helix-turn-helix (wHTH) protein
MTPKLLRVGDWCVDPASGQISKNGESARLEARTLRLLVCLAERAGEVVSIEELLNQAWAGVIVSPDSVYQAVTSLRRQLGDDSRQPTYIETVPRLGYRMVATVGPWVDSPIAPTSDEPIGPRILVAAGVAMCLMLAVGFVLVGRVASSNRPQAPAVVVPQPEQSVAVLPFRDLTEQMTEEPFADGMTVELIDKLSKVPGLRVHAPMSAASLKGKKFTIVDMAKMLKVAYVVDGSVRKSGGRLRIAARLIRGDDEYVVWSETYDRPLDDILMVQDNIAGEVTKALRASIEARPNRVGGV